VLVTANHPNALIDPLVVFRTAGRVVRPLAKAPLFEQALVGTVLKGLGGLPVYRRQDDPALMHLNDTTFDAAIAALHAGEAVQIFPEGQSHSGPSLAPLRTGAARIALMAEERAGWSLGLAVVPVGLTYVRKSTFRGRALATVGEPLSVVGYREDWEEDPQEAARALTEEITRRLEEVTLNLQAPQDHELVEVAERLYARQKGLVGWREREALADRLPRLQAFGRGLAWLRSNDPARYASLARAVARYHRLIALFGASEGDVPPRYTVGAVLRYVVRQSTALALLLIPAAVGVLAWVLPYQIPTLVARAARPTLDAVSTYKLGSALLAFPAMLAIWTALALWRGGAAWGVAVALALPLCGWAAICFKARTATVVEDARIFLRASRAGKGKERLAATRARLVEEFDTVAAEMAGAGSSS